MQFFLDNGHHAIGGYCRVNLDADCVLGLTPELFYLQVLLDPLEEEFYLPAVFVEVCYSYRLDTQCVGEEYELSVGFFVQIDDPADSVGIFLPGLHSVHMAYGIREYSGAFPEPLFPTLRLEVVVLLASDDKEGIRALYVVKTLEVIVTSVEDVERVLLVGYDIHGLRVMDFCRCDVEEGRHLGFNVIQRMHLDAAFPFPEQRPPENAQAQVDGRGVEGIDVPAELEDFCRPAFASFRHYTVGELLEDAVVAVVVRL